MNIREYLNAPIPRKTALAAVIGQGLGMSYATLMIVNKMLQMNGALIADLQQRNAILLEVSHFLIEHADDATASQLNENLDYWRIVRGVDPRDT